MDFFQTGMGRKYYEYQLPEQIKATNRLAAAVEENNRLLKLQLENQTQDNEIKKE